MSKKIKILILMIIGYFISLFLFELINVIINYEKDIQIIYNMEYNFPLTIFTTFFIAGIYHFICVSILAIICKIFFKIKNEYKNIIYIFPILTLIFTYPMCIPVTYVARLFGVFE